MNTYKLTRKRLNFAGLFGVLALFITSCATQNTATVGETDGIYAQNDPNPEYYSDDGSMNNYYKQYFQSKSQEYENLPEEDLIFTDIEAYSTEEYLDEDGYVVTEERQYDDEQGYGAWGTNADNVTVNIYDNGWNGAYGGWYNPYLSNYWGWGYGNPYSYWGWGWNRPYWSVGFGWGSPYWYGGYYNPYYYYGYNNFYNPYYYYGNGGYYGYNDIAYNRGRRNTDVAGRTTSTRANRTADNRGQSNVTDGRGSYSRSELNRRISNRNAARVQSNSRTVRSNTGTVRPSTNNSTIRRSTPRVNNSTRPTRSYSRPSSTRSTNSSVRRSSSPSVRSSSGSVRSSSGSVRSSSSGGRRGGRG